MSYGPFKRRPRKRGAEVLLCKVGPQRDGDDTYRPRLHFARLAKRKPRTRWGGLPAPLKLLWHFKNPKTGTYDVTRVWAYVPKCGSGQGYRATAVFYGKAPTCKRCLKGAA